MKAFEASDLYGQIPEFRQGFPRRVRNSVLVHLERDREGDLLYADYRNEQTGEQIRVFND